MDLEIHINRFRREIETAIRTFYAYDALLRLLSEQMYVDLINKNAHFWKIFEHTVHTEMFIAIGRLYDEGNDTFSFHKFINTCRDNIVEFGKESFEMRRLCSDGSKPSYLDSYVEKAYFARVEDIDALVKLAKPHTKRMKETYKKIRSKVIAHAILHDNDEINELYKDTNRDELEEGLIALWTVYNQVWQMYRNGRKPMIEKDSYPHKDEVYDCVKLAVMGGPSQIEIPLLRG